MSETRDLAIELRDERIKDLTDIMEGTIRETGKYNTRDGCYDINTSSILTKLIQEAGRWCLSYASDLFIEWKYNVDVPLEDGSMDNTRIVFAFRESGVDDEFAYEHNKENHHYYRAVWFLDVRVLDNGKIEMVLHKGSNFKWR